MQCLLSGNVMDGTEGSESWIVCWTFLDWVRKDSLSLGLDRLAVLDLPSKWSWHSWFEHFCCLPAFGILPYMVAQSALQCLLPGTVSPHLQNAPLLVACPQKADHSLTWCFCSCRTPFSGLELLSAISLRLLLLFALFWRLASSSESNTTWSIYCRFPGKIVGCCSMTVHLLHPPTC